MLHVNDDTNDELFRKAADDYFLKAETPDWENLLNKMITPNESAEDCNKKSRNTRRWLYFCQPLKKRGWKIQQALRRIFSIRAESKKSKKKVSAGISFNDAGLLLRFVNPLNSMAVI